MKKTTFIMGTLVLPLLASCGGKENSGTLSKPFDKPNGDPSEKGSISLPINSFNQLDTPENAGLSVDVTAPVTAGAEEVSFRLTNGGAEAFGYGYADILLQKKTGDGWETYQRVDSVQDIGISLKAGSSDTEVIRPAQYGVTLQSGAIYRIIFANDPEAVGEFRVT